MIKWFSGDLVHCGVGPLGVWGRAFLLILTTFHRRMLRCIACSIAFLCCGQLNAQPLNVQLLDARYTTFVSVTIRTNFPVPSGSTNISRTIESSFPHSDSLRVDDPAGWPYRATADASTGLFELSGATAAFGLEYVLYAAAGAIDQIRFSPAKDQVQSVGIQIARGDKWLFTEGSVSLLDLTSNSELWHYSWHFLNNPFGNIPWDPGSFDATANFNVDTDFLASHQYELTMFTSMDAASDSESAWIRVTGLEAVPEPASLCLTLMAQAGFRWPRDRPLLATLSAALHSIERGNSRSAVNQLLAFQNKVRAQVARSDPALAASFIQAAQAVIDVLRGR